MIDDEAIRSDVEAMLEDRPDTDTGLFRIRTANDWMQEAAKRPMPEQLFGEFWFEGELCIAFSDTNVGKTILGVQIGESNARGRPIDGIPMTAKSQTVLYFDFELSNKQFQVRYTNIENGRLYDFSENLIRCEIDPEADLDSEFVDFDSYLHASLEGAITSTGAKILVVDNLTYLKNETERAKDALPLMKFLKRLKSKYGLSILALAHTPKRDHSKPIGRNDLQGSKMLINFCDSSFAIGESAKEPGLRYLKQIKCRNAEIKFDVENVMLCQIVKHDSFLHFEFTGFGSEQDLLRQLTESDREERNSRIIELHRRGETQRQIAKHLDVSVGTVNSIIKRAK